MIFVEYIQRDRFMHFEIFSVLGDQAWWVNSDPDSDDEVVAQLARTLRLGPHPAYMAIWRCRGFEKLDEWERYFHSDEARADIRAVASHKAINLSDAGCYDELISGGEFTDGLHYIEYFNPDPSPESLKEAFSARADTFKDGELKLLLRRIGVFGPDPGGMAIWTFPDYKSLEGIVRDTDGQRELGIENSGAYRNWGKEIL
jgi:hypothetical protein